MEDTLVILAVSAPALAAVAGFFGAAWLTTRQHVRRLESILRGELGAGDRSDSLEQTILAMQDQLEAMREDQEFISRLLAKSQTPMVESGQEQQAPLTTPT